MGDYGSNLDVPSTSMNQEMKKQINLFDDDPAPVDNSHKLYNKEHFNSFSGAGAGHSTTGHFTFDDIFAGHHKHSKETKKSDFNDFAKFTSETHHQQQHQNKAIYATTSNPNNHQPYNFNFNQNYYPNSNHHHSQIHSNHHTNYQDPSVTMNINMNVYPNIVNINLNNPANPQPSQSKPSTFMDIKLDVNDFKID